MLSRPSQLQLLPVIAIMASPSSVSSHAPLFPNPNPFPLLAPRDDFPLEKKKDYLRNGTLDTMTLEQLLHYQTHIIRNYGMQTQFKDLAIHPQYPFIKLFRLCANGLFPIELLRFLWYFCLSYYVAIEVHTIFLLKNIRELGVLPYSSNFNRFFLWFDDLQTWKSKLEVELKDYLGNPQFGVLKVTEA